MNKTLIKYHVVANYTRDKWDCDLCDMKKGKNDCPFSLCPLGGGYYFKKNKL